MPNKLLFKVLSALFLPHFFIGDTIPVFYQSALRDFFSSLVLLVPLIFFKKWRSIQKKDLGWIIFRSVTGIFGFALYYIAINNIPMGTTYFLSYAGMLFGSFLFGKFLFGERLSMIKSMSLLLAFLGLMLIYSVSFQNGSAFFAFLSLIAGCFTSVWNMFAKKISSSYSALQLNYLDMVVTAVTGIFISALIHERWIEPSFSQSWLALAGMGSIFIITGQLIIYGFRHLEAQVGSIVMLMEIVFGLFLGFMLYDEVLSVTSLIGGALIIVAVVLPEFNYKKATRR